MEDLQTVDATHLQEQCPAFKEGCPYAKVDDSNLKEAIEKCPEFQNGCPFNDSKSLAEVYDKLSHVPHSAGHESELSGQKLVEMLKKMHATSESLEEKLGDCPVFHKDQGCPFKSVRSEEGKHLVEPASSVISHVQSVPTSLSDQKIMATGVSDLQEACPAFQSSCPFAEAASKSGAFESATDCPEFKDGCAFKDCKSVSDIYVKLKEIPDLEAVQGSHGKVLGSLKMLHDMCIELEKEMGTCPVFNTEMGCPFKTVCSDGKLMVVKMEENIQSRVIRDAMHEEKQEMEDQLLASSGIALHHELKERTKKAHKKTNTMPFTRRMVKGKINPLGYRIYLSNLYFMYRTLEEEQEKLKSHPMIKPVYFPVELERQSEIIKDLEYHYGEDWKDEIKPLDVTQRYMARVREVSENDPMLLVAHLYTRYLGDLAGGQILKKVFVKAYNLSGSEGVRFYEFENITNIPEFKTLYRSRLDSLQLSKEDADRMVNESLKSFDFHIEMFKELADICGVDPGPAEVEEQSEPPVENPVRSEPPQQDPTSIKPPGSDPLPKSSQPTEVPPGNSTFVGNVGHDDTQSSGMVFVVLGITVAMFAILYSYLLS